MISNRLQEILKQQPITSFCVANKFAISSILYHYKHKEGQYILFESTSNQVNHKGGYTGMTPSDYKAMVLLLAKEVGVPEERILFGGDHLGPLPFSNLEENKAMQEAKAMLESYIFAGFTKLHIDTSMNLGNETYLPKSLIAKRGVELISFAENVFKKYAEITPAAVHPVYVIGSEVPPAGGRQVKDNQNDVTTSEELKEVVVAYEREFNTCKLFDIWQYIVGIVIQPGVEYSHSSIDHFNPCCFNCDLSAVGITGLYFEAHSTDYQSYEELHELTECNFKILKVGPAITKSVTEALLKLEGMLELTSKFDQKHTRFKDVLLSEMKKDPSNWKKYYMTENVDYLLFSLLDRSRYYLSSAVVMNSIDELLSEFGDCVSNKISAGVIRYAFPEQFKKIPWETITAKELVYEYVSAQIDDYDRACNMK